MARKDLNRISEQLLLAVKMQEDYAVHIKALKSQSLSSLKADLKTDKHKKAFWINIYNAFYQISRKEKLVSKAKIYSTKQINIAGQMFSLDNIEHGILRKYRLKFPLLSLPNPFVSSLIKTLAVDEIDYRIHFALNCGAKSCPPIGSYSVDKIDDQLELATLSFLEGETEVDVEKKEIHISRLFKWFRGDFGGKMGIRNLLSQKLNIDQSNFALVYKEYSWEDDLENYV